MSDCGGPDNCRQCREMQRLSKKETMSEEALCEELEKFGFYDQLVSLHQQEHNETYCFCTSRIAPPYQEILRILAGQASKDKALAVVGARLDEIGKAAPPQMAHFFQIPSNEINDSWCLEYAKLRRAQLQEERKKLLGDV